MPERSKSPFNPAERDLIRLELMPRFGQEPDLANGLFLRTWRDGPQKGQPKIPKAIQTMLDRGLVQESRAMDPVRYGYLRRELGVTNYPPVKPEAAKRRGQSPRPSSFDQVS